MNARTQDGSAGDVDYGAVGTGYSSYRKPDTRIAQFIAEALDGARTVLNVGAGAGSYESAAGAVTPVEPSESMRARPARGPVVVLTCDPELVKDFWLYEYAPEVLDTEARRYPPIEEMAGALGGTGTIQAVPVPLDCTDGFNEAYYGRPEMLLAPAARQACSAWSFIDDGARARFDEGLRRDLESGARDERSGHLRTQATYEGALVIVRATI
ncbi:SAM-dependent methyltransferase [Streptomyces sp. NBC_00158]|uniref:SAM-dependent methyltransferase n=1 Tax=Streptomyces sp. NBC_00158 TaxID=2903627 RepID=UPI00324E6F1E